MADQPRIPMQENPIKSRAAAAASEAEAAAALRAELEIELKNKKQCAYQPYQCTQLTLDGFKYCMKHILNDRNAPYKQCTYVYQNTGKRCNLPAPKYDKKDYGYCHEHALKSTLTRNRQNSKYPPPHTAEVLLHSLSHYVKRPRNRTLSEDSIQEESEIKCTKSLDPFVDLDASSVLSDRCNEILDLCSESESDVEPSTFSSVSKDFQDDSSDNESIDSEQEDVLKHANVYTAEEVTRVTKEKLVRLQALYIEQYRHLQHLLREKRRKYLHALKREKETCCNIANQVRDNPKEQRMYKKLKYYNKYNRAFGIEAILNKRLHDLRLKLSDGFANKSTSFSKCTFTEGGVKCGEKALPCAKHCRKHILEDPHQVLFKTCGKTNADFECNTPVEAIFDDSRCRLHMEIPVIRSYHQPRKESESDADDSLDFTHDYPLGTNENVKTELIDYSMPPELPKMETLPSILFEDSSESMSGNIDFENTISADPKDVLEVKEEGEIDVSNVSEKNDDSPGYAKEEANEEIKEETESNVEDIAATEVVEETVELQEEKVESNEEIQQEVVEAAEEEVVSQPENVDGSNEAEGSEDTPQNDDQSEVEDELKMEIDET